ncbi:MAG: hypothetical protein H6838_04425 [Planctomycetes bacterium]|nr:hypothetical protein [Planctomycetota bacterium]
MFGTNPSPPQRFPLLLAPIALLGACGGGGGSAANVAPALVGATFVGATSTPAPGDTLQLFLSEDVALVGSNLLTDADFTLSAGASLGTVTAAPTLLNARAVAITLGSGVNLSPGSTTIAFSSGNDAVADLGGALGSGGAPVTIGTSDGAAPVISNVTIAGIDDALNGTGPAGGTLQVPVNGWTIDLAYSDNAGINTAATQVLANVAVTTSSGTQTAGTNLLPFLSPISASNTAASYRVPSATSFPAGAFTLSCVVVDSSGTASDPSTFAASVRPFTDALRPFETTVNSQQVWYLDFSRDIESFTTSVISGGISVDTVAGANSRSDFEDILHVLGLLHSTPIPNVSAGQDSNQVVLARFKLLLLLQLTSLYGSAPISFTTTDPGGTFTSSSVPYSSFGYSQISIAGAPTSAGVLGVAIFDPSNVTQNDNTLTNFSGVRLGVFLQTIADSGMGPPSSSAFRLTFGPLAPSLSGTAIGADAQDDQRLTGALTDSRTTTIDAAIADLARFTAVIVAHECGHSVGLVENGAMPTGLYGNDTTNFPGSSDGHIRTSSLFPAGATNVMSPALSYSGAVNAASAFNTLNQAYLREQVFYGN